MSVWHISQPDKDPLGIKLCWYITSYQWALSFIWAQKSTRLDRTVNTPDANNLLLLIQSNTDILVQLHDIFALWFCSSLRQSYSNTSLFLSLRKPPLQNEEFLTSDSSGDSSIVFLPWKKKHTHTEHCLQFGAGNIYLIYTLKDKYRYINHFKATVTHRNNILQVLSYNLLNKIKTYKIFSRHWFLYDI